MDLLDDMGMWVLIFYYVLSGLLRTDIEFSMIDKFESPKSSTIINFCFFIR